MTRTGFAIAACSCLLAPGWALPASEEGSVRDVALAALATKADLPAARPVLPSLLAEREAIRRSEAGGGGEDGAGGSAKDAAKAANEARAAAREAAKASAAAARSEAKAAKAAKDDARGAAEKEREEKVRKKPKPPHPNGGVSP